MLRLQGRQCCEFRGGHICLIAVDHVGAEAWEDCATTGMFVFQRWFYFQGWWTPSDLNHHFQVPQELKGRWWWTRKRWRGECLERCHECALTWRLQTWTTKRGSWTEKLVTIMMNVEKFTPEEVWHWWRFSPCEVCNVIVFDVDVVGCTQGNIRGFVVIYLWGWIYSPGQTHVSIF